MKKLFILTVLIVINNNSFSQKTARLLESGFIECYPENTLYSDSTRAYCEISATLFYNNKLYFANDKNTPCCSSVFYRDFIKGKIGETNISISNKQLENSSKFEDFSISPTKDLIMLTTGFDRYNPDNTLNAYNNLLYWFTDNETEMRVANSIEFEGNFYSIPIREKLISALKKYNETEEINYFKVEGLAILPDNRILFGIREIGTSFDDFHYVIQIVSGYYSESNRIITFEDNFEVVYEFVSETIDGNTIALASIEYNSDEECLYMLTSFEDLSAQIPIGAYLWKLEMEDFYKGKNPDMINFPQKYLSHKAEDFSFIAKNKVLIICDDDRILDVESNYSKENQEKRKANTSFYYIWKI